ncbi:MAG: hypothetical protein IPJ69_09040 [Deltaproteobacteria bacterium]|nr:MAG: hypothetical protein IPJ69_09040 [Deltaproteobacteria bacterium]
MLRFNVMSGGLPGAFLGPYDKGPGGFGRNPEDSTVRVPAAAGRVGQPDEGASTLVDETVLVTSSAGSTTKTSGGLFTISSDETILLFGGTPLFTIAPAPHDRVQVKTNPLNQAGKDLIIKHTVLYDSDEQMLYRHDDPNTPTLNLGDTEVIHQHDVILLVIRDTEFFRYAVTYHNAETGDRVRGLKLLGDAEFNHIIQTADTRRLEGKNTPVLALESVSVDRAKPTYLGTSGSHIIVGAHVHGVKAAHLAFLNVIDRNGQNIWVRDMAGPNQSWVSNNGYFQPLIANNGRVVQMGNSEKSVASEIRAGRTLIKTRTNGLVHEWDQTNGRDVEITRHGTTIDIHQVPYLQIQPTNHNTLQVLVMLTPDDPATISIQNHTTSPEGSPLTSGYHNIFNEDLLIVCPDGDPKNARRYILKVDPHTGTYQLEEYRNTREGETTIQFGDLARGGADTYIDEGDTSRVPTVSPLSADQALAAARAAKVGTAPLRAARRAADFNPMPPRQPTMPPVGLAPLTNAMPALPAIPKQPVVPTPLITPDPHENAMRMRINPDGSVRRDDEATKAHMLSTTRLPWANTPTRFRWYDGLTLGFSYLVRLGLKAVLRRRSA